MDILPILPNDLPDRPIIIAGPCSIETPEQTLSTAKQLAQSGIRIFRGGLWKPRTKPGQFEGVGSQGLPWLRQVKQETAMYVATEVAAARHVDEALQAGVDILWVGARTSSNPFAVQEIADALHGTDVPVLVKNPLTPDLELWIGALERFYLSGITRLCAVHRGFGSYDRQLYRNVPHWHIPIELHRRIPTLPILCDPSHIGGRRDLTASISQQALDMNFDGLMLEVHCSPDDAWSDAAQQITPEALRQLLQRLIVRRETAATEELTELRRQIDACDQTLMETLARRMHIAREIGHYKKEHQMPVVQSGRYKDILERYGAQAERCGVDGRVLKQIFEAIHEESVRQQVEIVSR
ncbi:MAG: bifunctional 3-deoxy-7-phosphoheptulonate synthase/chorismate mutase type II [Prevotellaceae bacterium]|jgi:chorismate mutase|nr:bifunctional 3-deoxy-7-phosphoheptulonate synthase/chorismate mutase type II [Prevotellaceae bacterium]